MEGRKFCGKMMRQSKTTSTSQYETAVTNTWDERYDKEGSSLNEPASFLKEHIHRLPLGKALDLAMGTGRNAIFLAMNGYEVDGIDFSEVAVKKVKARAKRKSLAIHSLQADLTHYRIAENSYDLIVNLYFLERTLFPQIKEGLREGGMILFETYTIEQPRYGRPHNPDHLLKPNELIHRFSDFHIIYYHERVDEGEEGPKAIASLLAQKGKGVKP